MMPPVTVVPFSVRIWPPSTVSWCWSSSVVVDAAGAGDLDGAGIGDRAAGQRHAAQLQRLAGIDIDRAGVGDRAAGHRGAVQRQDAGDVNNAGGVVGDDLVEQRSRACGIDRAAVGQRAVLQRRRTVQVDRAGIGDLAAGDVARVLQRQRRAGRNRLGIGGADIGDGAGIVQRQVAGDRDRAGQIIADGLTIERIVIAADIDPRRYCSAFRRSARHCPRDRTCRHW